MSLSLYPGPSTALGTGVRGFGSAMNGEDSVLLSGTVSKELPGACQGVMRTLEENQGEDRIGRGGKVLF